MKKTLIISLLLSGCITVSFAQTQKKTTTTTKKTTKTTTTTKKSNSLTGTKTPASTTKTTTTTTSTTGNLITNSISSLSDNQVSDALKSALKIGTETATSTLNKQDGFFGNSAVKIPFPQQISYVSEKLRGLGMGSTVDAFEKSMNRAAEDAVKEATPIFASAITQMSITDAKNILTQGDNAATQYLKEKCNTQLQTAFQPHVEKALNSSLATSYWKEITSTYNKIPFVTPVSTDLISYTTGKALDGMYYMVGQQEKKIRTDANSQITDILKTVFGAK